MPVLPNRPDSRPPALEVSEDPEALATRLYDELRAIARRELAGERADHTLQPTALVHEAFLRLIGEDVRFENRAHFFGAAARAIRRVLVDHSRRRFALRRDGDREPLHAGDVKGENDGANWVALDAALERLAERSPIQSRIVELRFFADLDMEQISAVLDLSPSSVQRQWRVARAWLRQELRDDGP